MDESVHYDNSDSYNLPSGSGLTLRLPPLKSSKLGKPGKKRRSSLSFADQNPKIPRPLKLKPLREVLTRLIGQIKKKDDYAFFLKPVDSKLVPGYADIIQRPMDFGTMTIKVSKGKYRSLEDFASDFKLVISNAKAFNPPGTIYHSEAERIETWGLDRITKAAATVIEYETDWNIEIEGDDDHSAVNDEDVDDMASPAPGEEGRRSPSIASNQPQGGRRGTRAVTTAKKGATGISEMFEPDGGLPGSKDGLGAFPPGSDWARVMLALKLKGKKYKTKKERMRVEKSGPPLAADGSLDYWETEDPFTILQAFAPEPLSKTLLTPLYPTTQDSLVSPPVQVSLKHKLPEVPPSLTEPSPKRRHWSINRQPTRSKPRDNEDNETISSSKIPREPQATDFAPFSTLMSDLTEEYGIQAVDEEAKLFDTLRASLQQPSSHVETSRVEAEDYIQDIVYGGHEGLAYLRSLAEFINPDSNLVVGPSGMTLSKFVEGSIVDNITQGRHRILQDIINHLHDSDSKQDSKAGIQDFLPILTEKIDLACLLRNPNELLQVENEWSGPAYKKDRRRMLELEKELSLTAANGVLTDPAEYLAFAIESHMQNEGDAAAEEPDDTGVFEHVLGQSKKRLGEILQSNLNMKEEDLTMRALRMDLLALAKRVPVDQIAFTSEPV